VLKAPLPVRPMLHLIRPLRVHRVSPMLMRGAWG
jgi:hypothetical protein